MKKSDQINTRPYGNNVAELHCPRCGSANLHHSSVTVFDCGEDSAAAVKTVVANGRVTVDPSANNDGGNPSSRRDGLYITFWCEGCGEAPIELTIAQHKGSTEIGWRFEPVS